MVLAFASVMLFRLKAVMYNEQLVNRINIVQKLNLNVPG